MRYVAGVIGYRNHSSKIVNILKNHNKIKKIIVFCYKKKIIKKLILENKNNKIFYTSIFSNLKISDFNFITSPSKTHLKYIKQLLIYKKNIFCEKPGFYNLKEYKFLKNLRKNNKRKIYFNYNLIHSKLYDLLKNELKKPNVKIINTSIYSTIGIAYLKKFKNNWRFNSKNILDRITGNLGVHHLNFSLNLNGDLDNFNISESCVARKNKIDTANIHARFKNDCTANIFLSYSAPATDRYEYYFSNNIIIYENSKIYKISPRNFFDRNGLFARPPRKLIYVFKKNIGDDSISSSVDYFISKSINGKNFSTNNFENALKAGKVFLSIN